MSKIPTKGTVIDLRSPESFPASDIRRAVPDIEVRNVVIPCEVRAIEGSSGPGKLVGYAARFNVPSLTMYDFWEGREFVEEIAPGAFRRSLIEKPDVRALFNHDTNIVLGRTAPGTLKLREDDSGLAFEVDLPDTQWGRDTAISVKRGDIDGCSFGFITQYDKWSNRADGMPVRTLLDVELHEISPAVAFPAYTQSSVSVRSRRTEGSKPGKDHRAILDAMIRDIEIC